jgi:hypothetical protein
MQLNITLKEAYGRASNRLRRKMEYSIHLLRKAEKLALAYDTRGGITLLSAEAKTVRRSFISHSWLAYNSRDT